MLVIKVDLEKAYDLIHWLFIRETLVDMGKPEGSISIIMNCITTPLM